MRRRKNEEEEKKNKEEELAGSVLRPIYRSNNSDYLISVHYLFNCLVLSHT